MEYGWLILGAIVLTDSVIFVGLIAKLLKKQDLLEEKLMSMSAQFPHQAYIELQQNQLLQSIEANRQQPQPDGHHAWESSEVS